MAFTYAIALSGGIATGKSTFKNLLFLYGFHGIDADKIAHQLLDQEHNAIAQRFGREYVDDTTSTPSVKRALLGKLIFSDSGAKSDLEALLHPKIKAEITTLAKVQDKKKFPYFIDIPLFFELGNYPIKKNVLIYTPFDIQLQRLQKRDGLSAEQAKNRIALQMPIEQKRRWRIM